MIFTALLIGLAGSLHCIGMCSPLIMAATATKPSVVVSKLVYNAGRIFTYTLLGMLVAGAGMALPAKNYQNLLSIILGIALLLIAFGGFKSLNIPYLSSLLQSFSLKLKILFGRFINQKNYRSLFLLGTINGLLPCGLTFLALTYCLTLRQPIEGFIFMLLFGVGTLPVMLGFTSILQYLIKRFQFNMRTLTTSMLVVSGIVLIAQVFIVHMPHAASIEEGLIDIVTCK